MSLIYGSLNFNAEQTQPLTFTNLTSSECHIEHPILLQSWIKADLCNKTQKTIALLKESELVILADARIYNRCTLAEKVGVKHLLSSLSDAELILFCYQKYSEQCVDHLIGDFAFAIWNSATKQLFLAQDPLGQRVLFYKISPEKFSFANLARPILQDGKYTHDKHQIAYFLTLIDTHSDTCFQDVKRIPPGHTLTFCLRDKKLQLQQYWSAQELMQNPIRYSSPVDYYTEFRELFQQVITEYVSSAESIGSQLSGGLDSSTVTCIAAALLQKNNITLNAFCHVPSPGFFQQPTPNWNYSDKPYMQAVAEQYKNVQLNFIEDSDKQFFSLSPELHFWLEHPPLNPCNLLWLISSVKKAQSLNVKNILCGTVGNFTVSWTGSNSITNSSSKNIKKFIWAKRKRISEWRQGRRYFRPWGHFSAVSNKLAREIGLYQHYNLFSPIENRMQIKDDRFFVFATGIRCITTAVYTVIRLLYGVSFMDPTADRRIVEFCLRVPPEIFGNASGTRLLIRNSMHGIIPEMIINRQSRGMQGADWYKKIEKQKHDIEQLLKSWRKTEVNNYIDIKMLLHDFKKWDYQKVAASQGKEYLNFELRYRSKLLRAMEMGLFIENSKN